MVKVQVARNDGDGMRLVYRSMWPVRDGVRDTVFIIPSTTERSGVSLLKFVERASNSIHPDATTNA